MDKLDNYSADKHFHIVKFGNQDIPAFVEQKNVDSAINYVLYGEKNDYPYYLIDLYTRSAYHKAIIDGKVRYMTGGGWTYDNRNVTSLKQSQVNDFLSKNFGNDTLDQSSQKWAIDLEIFNGMAAEVIYTNGGKISSINYIDFSNIRSNPERTKFFYTSRWFTTDKQGKRIMNKKPFEEKDWKVYDCYDPESNKKKSQLYYFSVFHPNQQVYPLPSYSGGVIWVNVDIALSDFHYHNIKNGFVPAHIINFYNGIPDEIKQEEIENRILEKWTGEKGQRIVLNFAMSKETGTDVQTLQMSDIDKQYIEVAKQSEQKIFSCHFANPILFGIAREGALGQRSEIDIAHNEFNQMYVIPRQKLIEDMVNMFIADYEIGVHLKLKTVQPLGYNVANAKQENLDIISALNTLPDAVASKILDSMSATQILGLVGLQPQSTSTSSVQTKFFNDDKAIEIFSRFGKNRLECEIVHSEPFEFTEGFDFDSFEQSMMEKFSFADEKTKGGVEADIIISDPTKTEIKKYPSLEVRWSYELSPNAPALVKGGVTRKFCQDLLDINHLYTKAEIMAMSNETTKEYGKSVWEMRGGWYTKPDTTIHIPHCRHTWQSNLVKV